jgi:hypothetical protein
MVRKAGIALGVLLCFLGIARLSLSQSQYREFQRLMADLASHRQPPNDTEFVFARVRFTSHGPGRARGDHSIPGWAHDYPDGEEHLLQIASEVTGINLNKMSYVIVDLGSEELFRYPFAYLSEVGEMTMGPEEVANLREYLNRGGFAVADDLDGPSLEWFAREMERVFPGRDYLEMTLDHPVFHSFYDIPDLAVEPPYPQPGPTKFHGYFDDHGRLCIVLNTNNDMGDFWEWIDQPEYPLAPSTEALRFGVNYLVYSLTH